MTVKENIKQLIVTAALMAAVIVCKGQNPYFSKTFDIPENQTYGSVRVIDSSIFVFGGSIWNNVMKRYWARFDFNGNLDSSKHYFTNVNKSFHLSTGEPAYLNGHFYMQGYDNESSGFRKASHTKINLWGDTIYYNVIDTTVWTAFNDVSITKDLSLVYAGSILHPIDSLFDIYVVKTDTNANILWEASYSSPLDCQPYSIDTCADGGFLVSGYYQTALGNNYRAFYMKVDSVGNLQWQRFLEQSTDVAFSKTINGVNHLLFTMEEVGVDRRAICYKINNAGDTVSSFRFYEEQNQLVSDFIDVVVNDNNEFVFSGNTVNYEIAQPVGMIVCLDTNLNLKWYRKYHVRENNDNYFTRLDQMPDGGYAIVGYAFPDAGFTQDGWLVRTNCIGYDTVPYPHFEGYNMGGNLAEFYSTSRYAEEYHWDFGDGNTYTHWSDPADTLSTEPFVQHQYSAAGNYTITLQAIACQDTTTYTQVLQVDPNNVTEQSPVYEFSVYPNPGSDFVYVEFDETLSDKTVSINVYDIAGKSVYEDSYRSDV